MKTDQMVKNGKMKTQDLKKQELVKKEGQNLFNFFVPRSHRKEKNAKVKTKVSFGN